MSKNTTMSKNITTLITIGYDTKLVVPVERVSAVLAILRDCPLVVSEWDGKGTILVRSKDRIDLSMGEFPVLTREDYEALPKPDAPNAKHASGLQKLPK